MWKCIYPFTHIPAFVNLNNPTCLTVWTMQEFVHAEDCPTVMSGTNVLTVSKMLAVPHKCSHASTQSGINRAVNEGRCLRSPSAFGHDGFSADGRGRAPKFISETHTHTLTQLSGPGVLHFLLLSTAASRNTECVIYVLNYSRKQQAAGQEVETNQCLGRSACRLTCTCSLIQTLFWTL